MTSPARSFPAGQDERSLMPSSSPPPALRRPARTARGRYLSNDLEREYAMRAEQLDALEQDIRRARKASRHPRSARREPPPAPHGEPASLADGARILIRPIEAGDAQELRAGFEQLDVGSRYQRFLAPVAYLTQRQLDYLTHVDHTTHEALVAVDAATGEGIGIARFVRDGRDPECADVAIVVADRWHGRGVGALLADRLAARARKVGVKSFTARTLAGNHAARRLVERVGQDIREREDGGAIVLAAQLRKPGRPGGRAGSSGRRRATRVGARWSWRATLAGDSRTRTSRGSLRIHRGSSLGFRRTTWPGYSDHPPKEES